MKRAASILTTLIRRMRGSWKLLQQSAAAEMQSPVPTLQPFCATWMAYHSHCRHQQPRQQQASCLSTPYVIATGFRLCSITQGPTVLSGEMPASATVCRHSTLPGLSLRMHTFGGANAHQVRKIASFVQEVISGLNDAGAYDGLFSEGVPSQPGGKESAAQPSVQVKADGTSPSKPLRMRTKRRPVFRKLRSVAAKVNCHNPRQTIPAMLEHPHDAWKH